jgi:hypothetical protein
MNKKSPEINQPVSAGRRESKNRKIIAISGNNISIFETLSIFRLSAAHRDSQDPQLSAASRDKFGIISGFTSV